MWAVVLKTFSAHYTVVEICFLIKIVGFNCASAIKYFYCQDMPTNKINTC